MNYQTYTNSVINIYTILPWLENIYKSVQKAELNNEPRDCVQTAGRFVKTVTEQVACGVLNFGERWSHCSLTLVRVSPPNVSAML
jgi:hypothetical protein